MFDVELYRSESFVVHLLHRIQEISRSGISLFFLRGLQRLSSVIIEYWLQTHALSSFDLLSLSLSLNLSKLGAIGAAIGCSSGPIDITWLAESYGLIFESRARRDGLD